jgi:hypothetical protein
VLVRRLPVSRRDAHDDQVPELLVRPRRQVGQAGLLGCLAAGDGQRVALPRVAVPAHLQPGLLPLVPAQQNSAGFWVHDQRGRGDVERELTAPRVVGGLGQISRAPQVARLGLAFRLVVVQDGQGRP